MCKKDDADDATPKTSVPTRRTIDSFLLSDYSATLTDENVPMMQQVQRNMKKTRQAKPKPQANTATTGSHITPAAALMLLHSRTDFGNGGA